MRGLPPRRLTTRAPCVAVSLAATGALSLVVPAVAAASSGHGGGGGGLFVAVPLGSIFSDILGSVAGFGKDVIKTIFSSILTLFFGGSWKVLLHPYEIVEWLIGLPGTGNTTAFVPFGNNGAGPFAALVHDTQAIGLGLLPLALANNTLHLVSGGIFTRPRDHMHDFGKVFMAACAIIAWPWLFGQAIDIANTITLAMLQAANANGNLWKTLAVYFVTAWSGGFLDLLTTAFLIATVILLVGLIVMKIVLMVALAFLLVVGPIAIAFYPFEFLSRVLMLFGSVFLALAMVPLGWAVLFALFTAFGASVFGFSNFIHAGLIGGAMTDTFDLICSLICFYLAWKWPFLILGRLSSLIGGNVAAAGEALSSFGRGGAGAGAGVGAGGGSAASGALAGAEGGGRLAGALQGLGGFAQGLGAAGGGALSGLGGSSAAMYAGYGLGAKGLNGVGAASSALRRNGDAGGVGSTGGQPGDGASGQLASPVGTAVADEPDAGFDAVRASGKNFSAGADALGTSGAALAGVAAGSRAAGAAGGGEHAPAAASTQTLARDAALTAALTSSAGGSATLSRAAAATRRNGAGASGPGGAGDASAQVRAGLNGTPPAPNGSPQPVSPASPASPASAGSAASPATSRTGAVADGDSDARQVLQASPATASAPAAAASVRSEAEPHAAPPSPGRLAATSAPGATSAPATHPASPAAARAGAPGSSPSGPRSGGHTAPPAAPRASRSAPRNGGHTPPPVGAAPGTSAGRTAPADGPSQAPERPPAPVSAPESR
jgi:hypothetical protein